MSWGKLGQVGNSWDKLGQVGTNWEPKKLQKFDIKKKPLEKEERKKKNIGYRVASNERRLKKEAKLTTVWIMYFTRIHYKLSSGL